MFRISRDDQEQDVDDVEQIEPAIAASPRGRYHVDEIRPVAIGPHVAPMGVGIRKADEMVVIERDPWEG